MLLVNAMAKLLDANTFRRRYFEQGGPSDDDLEREITTGALRGTIICGKPWIADDALFNNEPWQPSKKSKNPLLAGT